MAVIKRKRSSGKKSTGWKKWKKNVPRPVGYKSQKKFARAVMSVVNHKAEVKKQMLQICENATIYHNIIHNLMVNVFVCKVGSLGDNIFPVSGGVRIGNEIFVKGLKMSINLESQQYRPQVTYHMYLIRGLNDPGTQITTKGQIFEGVSSTIPCDYVDTTKVHILYHKKFTLKMPNGGTTVAMSQSADGTQFNGGAYEYSGDQSYHMFTNPQFVGKFYVPINKKIKYLDYGDNVNGIAIGPHYYQWIITGYDNFTTRSGAPTVGDGYPLGHITLTQQMVFTDV